jgi:hypothetical protein
MNRTEFIKKSSKTLALGLLTHFSLLGGGAITVKANAGGDISCESQEKDNCQENNHPHADDCQPPPNNTPDNCPGGMPLVDVCDPSPPRSEPDLCPGEGEADECTSGEREEDLCMTEVLENDECLDASAPATDQCESGRFPADECESGLNNVDACPSGVNADDVCRPDGGEGEDICPGGGNNVDNCLPTPAPGAPATGEGGDVCPKGGLWWLTGKEDDCRPVGEEPPDKCGAIPFFGTWDDDSCIAGTGAGQGENGENDWCSSWGGLASDVCIDGKPESDLCASRKPKNGTNDTCPGGGSDVDDCNAVSDDYCSELDPTSDECHLVITDPDECPGGALDADVCRADVDPDECAIAAETDECNPVAPFSDPDECPTHNSKSDECIHVQDTDECPPANDVCIKSPSGGLDICTATAPDNPE